ncbi:MAG: hypothetical protein FJ390_03350 [Verrucomicrobia bacterium]|nr:hypothetical protein [Verrucomicrobiota bacterium]
MKKTILFLLPTFFTMFSVLAQTTTHAPHAASSRIPRIFARGEARAASRAGAQAKAAENSQLPAELAAKKKKDPTKTQRQIQ